MKQIKEISRVDLALDRWMDLWGEYIPSEDVSIYTLFDYIRDMYLCYHTQFAVRYYE